MYIGLLILSMKKIIWLYYMGVQCDAVVSHVLQGDRFSWNKIVHLILVHQNQSLVPCYVITYCLQGDLCCVCETSLEHQAGDYQGDAALTKISFTHDVEHIGPAAGSVKIQVPGQHCLITEVL